MDNQEMRISREEVEKRIRLAMEDIWSDYLAYNPEGKYLELCMTIDPDVEDGNLYFSAVNAYWNGGEDEGRPVCFRVFKGVEE